MAKWYYLTNINLIDKEISADIKVTPDSPWFSGHFPGDPILPGIAQLAMVFDVIKEWTHDDLKITFVRRVRFKQTVKPGDQLKLTILPSSENPSYYSFRIILDNDVVCIGAMLLTNNKEK